MLTIGLFGCEISSANKGVAALAVAQLKIINDICSDLEIDYNIVIFSNEQKENITFTRNLLHIENIQIDYYEPSYRRFSSLKQLYKKIKNINLAIDITGGDSFSDIYGVKLFFRACIHKLFFIISKTKYMLAPQTYGPYYHLCSRLIAFPIIKKANIVISRDKKSRDYLADHVKNTNIIVGTDVAFTLPYDNSMYIKNNNSEKLKIGINVSQLLCSGMFSAKDGISLNLNYMELINKIIENILLIDNVEIHLIPHVVDSLTNENTLKENDCIANRKIKEKYPDIVCAPDFKNPIEAKSYISNMDIFIGSRMHATIAAISSGVVTIPIAYSRKFKGLFENVGYKYTIDITRLSIEETIKYVMKYINDYKEIKLDVSQAEDIIKNQLKTVYDSYKEFILKGAESNETI